jgi:hypothetical protein
VVAFGREDTEAVNYERYLKTAKDSGKHNALKGGLSLAYFQTIFEFVMTYAFTTGLFFIYYRVENPLTDEPYTSGEILAIFFGVLFGM